MRFHAAALSLLAGLALQVGATDLPHESRPGGVAVVALPPDLVPAEARLGDRRVMLRREDSVWFAVIGIPLDYEAGEATLSVTSESGERRDVPFHVGEAEYKTQHLTVPNRRHVEPSAEDLERIGRERKIIDRALTHWDESPPAALAFPAPVGGRRSSSFGLRRFFNGQPRKPHSGMDIAAATGTPINAPLAGRVLATGDFFFNGNTIIVDHGQGLITLYCHLDSIAVNSGQTIEPGHRLGNVGATGRVTGPHLHWGVYLNGTAVDPAIFVGQTRL